jgi:hypothetical protein
MDPELMPPPLALFNSRSVTYPGNMAKPRVYVETTIPSFYHDVRSAPEIVARRQWTRQWWDSAADRFELVTSPAVLDELANGPAERRDAWIDLVRDLPLLAVDPAVGEIVQAYIRHHLMPADPGGDALRTWRWPPTSSAISW